MREHQRLASPAQLCLRYVALISERTREMSQKCCPLLAVAFARQMLSPFCLGMNAQVFPEVGFKVLAVSHFT